MSETKPARARILEGLGQGQFREALEAVRTIPTTELASEVDETVTAALIPLLGDPNRTGQRHTADTLAAVAPKAPALARGLAQALQSPDPRLRWGAAYTLGHAHKPPPTEIWPSVLETLACEDADQRWAAAELTCDLMRSHSQIRREITDAIDGSPPTLRRMLLYCMRDVHDPDLLEHARAGLDDADAGVRLAALAAARTSTSGSGLSSLANQIAPLLERDPDPGVRRAAAATLGKMGRNTPQVAEALAQASGAGDPGLARAATSARMALGSAAPKN